MPFSDLGLVETLQALPSAHAAAIYDVDLDVDQPPVWSNDGFKSISKDLQRVSGSQLAHRLSRLAHSSTSDGEVTELSLGKARILHASMQIKRFKWIVLIGVVVGTPEDRESPLALPMLDFNPLVRSSPVVQLTLSFDWAANTSLGPMQKWPQSLKSVVSIMLSNPNQSCIFWGPDRTLLYNDAWAKGSASKHPHLLGQPGKIAFQEIWDTFSLHCDMVYRGESVGRVDDLLFFNAKPNAELTPSIEILNFNTEDDEHPTMELSPDTIETYYTWSYIPVQAEDGNVGGIVNLCMETTDKVILERRLKIMRSLAENTGAAKTSAEFWESVTDVLSASPEDFPYVLCYIGQTAAETSLSEQSDRTGSEMSLDKTTILQLQLVVSIGVEAGHPQASPLQLSLNTPTEYQWPWASVCASGKPRRCKNPCPAIFEKRGWGDEAGDAMLIPLKTTDGALSGLVVLGLNTRRPYDEQYSGFHNMVVATLQTSWTATQSIEQELMRAEELLALDRAKTAFFQNVSHELRTPLTLIRGPCEDALKTTNPAMDALTRNRFKLIHRASGRLLRLVNSLMMFSSAEAKRLQATFSPIRLGPFTADLASLFRSAIEKAGIIYNVDCGDADDERVVYIDASMWEKIVFNLLSNALKYSKLSGGLINVVISYRPTEVVLHIEDTGCGIPEHELDKVFDRFHRVEHSDGKSNEGTGIGLALTNELVKIHHGTLTVKSIFGTGSVFTVRLPLGSQHLPQKDVNHNTGRELESGAYAAGIVEEAGAWLQGDDSDTSSNLSLPPTDILAPENFTVLLAEDNADARMYIKSILLTAVQDVVTFSDGQAALDWIHEHGRPDLLITDIMMPRLTGLELLQALNNDPDPNIQAIPVIILSARSGNEHEPGLFEPGIFSGTVDFLHKPFTSSELLHRVHARLHALRQKHALESQVRQRTLELKVSQERYQRMSELSPVALFETDEQDHESITYANERFFAITGLTREGPVEFNDIIERLSEDHQERARRTWSEASASGQAVNFDTMFDNGKNVFVEVVALSDGRLLGTMTDQTEQRRSVAEQLSLERAKVDEAVQRRRLQEAFIDIISHELRNPLSAIIQSADLLTGSVARLEEIIELLGEGVGQDKLKLLEESRMELADAMDAVSSVSLCAHHQTIIANDILAVSRLDSNLIGITPHVFYILDQLQTTLDMYYVHVASQNIKFTLHTFDESLAGEPIANETCLLADKTRFCQILVNLISNACRILEGWDGERRIDLKVSLTAHRPFGDRVSQIQEVDDGTRVWIGVSISDTGPGIPLDDQARLFTRFNDINGDSDDSSRKALRIGGTGLGLYLCKKLVELQGGQIRHSPLSDTGGAAFDFFIEARREMQPTGVARRTQLLTKTNSPRDVGSRSLTPMPHAHGVIHHDFATPSPGLASPSLNSRTPPLARAQLLILVVEDNSFNQKLLRRQLEKAGFQVQTADNGLKALEYLESCIAPGATHKYPLVVLMDLEMPVLDGLSTTTRIREWESTGKLPPPRLIVWALTGNARQGQLDAARDVGMDRVYIKPYKFQEIVEQMDLEAKARHSDAESYF
ncbi:hypothetical protein C8J56DRAFT_1027754 [Mycena floridula]|nr:hypothetical protein C8J56DRAFT_1027754 [Mycena floridula]